MSDDTFYCSFVSIQYIICECGETFPSEDDLKKHLEHDNCRKEINEYKCGVCGEIYLTEQECLDHYDQNHEAVVFEDDHNYTIKSEHSENDSAVQHIKEELIELHEIKSECEEVPDDISSQYEVEYTEHPESEQGVLDIVKLVKPRKPREKRPSKRKNIVCEVCGKNYASNAALRYHQRVHTGERPYKCTMCPKTFTMPLFLQVHMRTHTGERPYQCALCPKAFSNKAALLRHDRVHTGIKPYACPRCGKSFTQSNSMKLHVNTVHLKQPAPYKSKSRKMRKMERERETRVDYVVQEDEDMPMGSVQYKIDPQMETAVQETEVLVYDSDSKDIAYEVVYEV